MNLSNQKTTQKISIWALVFTLTVVLSVFLLMIPAEGKTILDHAGEAVSDVGSELGEAVSDVEEAVSDVGDGIGEAVSDLTEGSDGIVSDDDGVIGNETETDVVTTEEGLPVWVGVLIALAIVAVVIVLIVVLVPKKKER